MTVQAAMFQYGAAERYATAHANNNSGAQRKSRGQDAVRDAEGAEWYADAIYLLRQYVSSMRPGDLFAFEDFRAYTETCELRAPHTHKCWGALPRMAVSQGVNIRMTDRTRPASSPRTNSHRVSLWMVTEPIEEPA